MKVMRLIIEFPEKGTTPGDLLTMADKWTTFAALPKRHGMKVEMVECESHSGRLL